MKRWLITGTFALALFIGGCSANPAAAPGPQGPQGQPGAQGAAAPDTDRDRDKDRDRREQDEREREQAQQGTTPSCPAGEHLYKNPNDGRTSCVRD